MYFHDFFSTNGSLAEAVMIMCAVAKSMEDENEDDEVGRKVLLRLEMSVLEVPGGMGLELRLSGFSFDGLVGFALLRDMYSTALFSSSFFLEASVILMSQKFTCSCCC